MNLADNLAEVLFSIHQQSRQRSEEVKNKLLACREELCRELEDSGEAEDVNQRRIELKQSVSRLELEMGDLQNGIAERSERTLNERQLVWEMLRKTCHQRLALTRDLQISREFNSAIEAFKEQLSEAGFYAETATEEERLRKIPDMREMAAQMRAAAQRMAMEASSQLGKTSEVRGRWRELNEQQARTEQEFEEVLKRLKAHGHDPGTGLVSEIRSADKRVAQRLLREIIEPKLVDSRIEREKGLSGADPLQHAVPRR